MFWKISALDMRKRENLLAHFQTQAAAASCLKPALRRLFWRGHIQTSLSRSGPKKPFWQNGWLAHWGASPQIGSETQMRWTFVFVLEKYAKWMRNEVSKHQNCFIYKINNETSDFVFLM